MNKNVITSISLLVAGVIIGVVVCIICLTTVEWQKACKANQSHTANRQIAAEVSTASDARGSQTKNRNLERNLHIAHASAPASGTRTSSRNVTSAVSSANSPANSQPNSALDPATRTVIPNILHQAIQTAPMQGQWGGSGMTPANGMVSGDGMAQVQVMPTTFIIQQPPLEIIVPGSVGPNRAVNSVDAVPMPIGANGLQQNPCVDPSSSYGRAYNRNASY